MPETEVITETDDEVQVETEVGEEIPVTYSQEDFDKELEKRVNEKLANVKQEVRDEAKRLSELTDEEAQQEKFSAMEKELAELKAERTKLALEKSVSDILVSRDLPTGLTDSLVKIGDADTIKSVVDEIQTMVTERVESGIQEAIKQPTPKTKATLPSGDESPLTFAEAIDKAAKEKFN
ncbi:scaffold protein [Weissella phage PWc]|nr:scaffold protein [Weissella phage PWc]